MMKCTRGSVPSKADAMGLGRAAHNGNAAALLGVLEGGVPADTPIAGAHRTALAACAAAGETQCVRHLLRHGADVALAVRGHSALRAAALNGQDRAAALLLAHGAQPDPPLGEAPPLHAAAAGDHHRVAQLLLEAGARPCRVHEGYTPLAVAAMHNSVATAALLLEQGCGTDGVLRLAAESDHAPVLRLLLHHGAAFDDGGGMVLQDAVLRGSSLEVIDLLLAAGASPYEGPLLLSETFYHKDALLHLLAHGFDPNSTLELLTRNCAPEDLLLHVYECGAAPPVGALHAAVSAGQGLLLRYLLKGRGLDPNERVNGLTPLHVAAARQTSISCLRALLQQKAAMRCIDAVTQSGDTALILAARAGVWHAVRSLVGAGADAAVVGSGGRTALEEADHHRHSQCALFLKSGSAGPAPA